jgi:hypothetical protein
MSSVLVPAQAFAGPKFQEELNMQVIMHEVMDALSSFVKLPDFGSKAMSLLGKLGGRSHAHINGAQNLAYKANPEQGLRATLTFRGSPPTTFLLPLDRIIHFVTAGTEVARVSTSPHFRRQAFKLVKTCLATMMNLDSQFEDVDREEGEQLVAVLLGHVAKQRPAPIGNVSVKTKLQQQAEERCFQVRICARVPCAGLLAVLACVRVLLDPSAICRLRAATARQGGFVWCTLHV